jgi:para-nitrobenzyl esterase
MQPEGDFEPIQTTPSEDCLHLNVWRPTNAPADAKLPVLFWIHGGFVGGGTSIPFYDGSAFARQGIVVVSPNYRLGRLGFFAHPALLKANEGPAGNFGYMDQIAAFGGDPSKVTIIGQSAGGASVLALFTSPVTKGLFYQAMVMSGAV